MQNLKNSPCLFRFPLLEYRPKLGEYDSTTNFENPIADSLGVTRWR